MRAIITLTLTGLMAGSLLVTAQAEIFKCKEADGTLTFSQTPCSKEEPVKVQKVAAEATDDALDCSYANRFATATAREMRRGISSDELFNNYGGLDALSRGSIGVINYVYSFRTNLDVSAERIAGLAQAKCKAKSFGDVTCESLPTSFTDSFGGCDAGAQPASNPPMAAAQSTPALNSGTGSTMAGTAPVARAVGGSRDSDRIAQCRTKYRDEIDAIDAKMRGGYSSEQGERYRAQLRALKAKLRACG